MNRILLKFLTAKGEQAYKLADEAGKKESRINRKIVKTVFKDKAISTDPLTIEITIRSPRLALTIDLPKQITTGLEKFGAKPDRDYTMEVS